MEIRKESGNYEWKWKAQSLHKKVPIPKEETYMIVLNSIELNPTVAQRLFKFHFILLAGKSFLFPLFWKFSGFRSLSVSLWFMLFGVLLALEAFLETVNIAQVYPRCIDSSSNLYIIQCSCFSLQNKLSLPISFTLRLGRFTSSAAVKHRFGTRISPGRFYRGKC